MTDWATADCKVHDNLAQALPAKTEKGTPVDLEAKRNNWLKNSDPSRFTDPVDSRTKAEKSKLVSTKLSSNLRCFNFSAKYSQGDSLAKCPAARGQVTATSTQRPFPSHQMGMVTSRVTARSRRLTPNTLFFQNRTQLAFPSELVNEIANSVVSNNEVPCSGAANSMISMLI